MLASQLTEPLAGRMVLKLAAFRSKGAYQVKEWIFRSFGMTRRGGPSLKQGGGVATHL